MRIDVEISIIRVDRNFRSRICLCLISICFFFNISAQGSLVSPSNGLVQLEDSIHFSWDSCESVDSYEISVSNSPSFSSQTLTSVVQNQFEESYGLGTYYWRVRCIVGGVPQNWSSSRTYSIVDLNNYGSLAFWVSADSTLVKDGSNRVSEWNGISVNNLDFIQGTSNSQPIWTDSLQKLNNKPALHFDGVDDFLEASISSIEISSLFVLANWSGVQSLFPDYNGLFMANSGPLMFVGTSNSSNLYTTGSSVFNGNQFINGVQELDFSPLKDFKVVSGHRSNSQNYSATGFRVGRDRNIANRFWEGYVPEVIAFSTTLGSNEIDSIHEYLRFKYAPPVNLGPNISQYGFCDTSLYAGDRFESYLWSDGSTADSLIVSEPGTYWVEVTDIFGYESTDTIQVQMARPNYPNLQTYCPSDSTTWHTNLGPDYNYLWSDGSTADSISIDTPGDYHVEITDTNGCVFLSDTLTFDPDPFESIVTLGPDLSLCSGNTLTLQDGDSLAVDYLWNTSSTDSVITLNSTGTYYVDVVNANGCEASDTIEITIIGDAPNVVIGLPNTVCEGEEFTFEDFSNTTDGSTITDWEWNMNDGTVINAQDSSHVYLNDAAYEVSLTISTDAGCSASDIQQVTAIPKPDLTFVSSNECQNSIVQFNGGQLTPTTISTWEWDFDDPSSGLNNTASGQNVTHTFDSSGDFDIMLIGIDINGCSDTAVITKTILPSPIVDFDFTEVCEGNIVSFDNLTTIDFPGLINGYNWSFGDGTNSGQSDPQKPYNVSGNYVVNLVATGNNGCSGQQSQNIKIHAIPVVDQVVESSCAGINTNFMDNSFVSNGSVAQVDWSINNDAPLTGFSLDQIFDESGSISVQQTVVSAFGCSNSTTFNVDIEDFLDASFDFSPNAFISGSPIAFNSTSQGADNYEWTFESIGSSILPDTTIVFPESSIGDTLSVQLAVENSFGCRDSAILELPVLERSTDLLIDELFLQESGGFYTVGARLTNLGTTPITEVDLYLNSPSVPVIKETWTGNLQATESTIYIFSSSPSSIVPFKDTAQNYVCVRGSIVAPSLFSELDLSNNEICKLIEPSQSVVIAPQPNPIGNSYSIKVILSSSEIGTLKVFDAQGRVVDVVFENKGLKEGLNLFEVDASHYANGGYTLRYVGESQSRQVKIIKQ